MFKLTEDKYEDFWAGLYKYKFHIEIVRKLHERFKDQIFYVSDKDGFYLLHWAAIVGNDDLVEYILLRNVPPDQPMADKLRAQAIHLAAMEGHVNVIHVLLQYNANVDSVDKKGCTALMRAANYGTSINYRSHDMVLFLLFNGANPKQINSDGFSALHFAIQACNHQVVTLLLRIKMPVTPQTISGPSALHMAVQTGDRQMIKAIISASPNVNKKEINRFVNKYAITSVQSKIQTLFDTMAKVFTVCFIIGTIVWEYPQYVFIYFPATPELLPVHVFLLIISSICWCLWAKVVFADPGFVPTKQSLYEEIISQRLPMYLKRKSSVSKTRKVTDPYAFIRLCHLCRCVQPQFAHHCHKCNRCVMMHDHHCVYLCNCIGFRNRIPFYALLVCMSLCGMLNMLVVINAMTIHRSGVTLLHSVNLLYSTKLIVMGLLVLAWQMAHHVNKQKRLLRANPTRLEQSPGKPQEEEPIYATINEI